MNSFYLYECVYNLFIFALFDLDNNYLSYSQPYPLALAILTTTLNWGITPKNTHTTHATTRNNIPQNKASPIKKKRDLYGVI